MSSEKKLPLSGGKKRVPFAAAVTGTVAILGLIVGFLSIYPPDWLRMALDPAQATSDHVNKCMDRHQLKMTPNKETTTSTDEQSAATGEYSKAVYSACTWPATNSTGTDGYSEIIVLTVVGFGEFEATSATVFDRIRASCGNVELIYNRAGMGHYGSQPAVRLKKGDVAYAAEGTVLPYTGPWESATRGGIEVDYPDPSEIIVLHNGSRVLSLAQCV